MIKLSICIATYNRAQFISETLDSILVQIVPSVELVIVDGASSDNTREIIQDYVGRHPAIRYFRENKNSGVDEDYDKAVSYASGEYCWLMTDDDLLRPGAIMRVLSSLDGCSELLVVNAETRTADLSATVESRRLGVLSDCTYGPDQSETFFSACANYLSFIGGVVISRAVWLSRDRRSYYGSLFVHVGVIFQDPPIANVRVIAEPFIVIRLGNAMWTPRSFEIWALKWPQLIWSFASFTEGAKRTVCDRDPWRRLNSLFYNRAIGAYSVEEFVKYVATRAVGGARLMAYVVARFPGTIANCLSVAYVLLKPNVQPLALYSLLGSRYSNVAGRLLIRTVGRRRVQAVSSPWCKSLTG